MGIYIYIFMLTDICSMVLEYLPVQNWVIDGVSMLINVLVPGSIWDCCHLLVPNFQWLIKSQFLGQILLCMFGVS